AGINRMTRLPNDAAAADFVILRPRIGRQRCSNESVDYRERFRTQEMLRYVGHGRRKSPIEPNRQHGAALSELIDACGDRMQLLERKAEWFLHEYMLSSSEGCEHNLSMQVVAGSDKYSLGCFVGENFLHFGRGISKAS